MGVPTTRTNDTIAYHRPACVRLQASQFAFCLVLNGVLSPDNLVVFMMFLKQVCCGYCYLAPLP